MTNRGGFTIIEIVISLLIISVLAVAGISSFDNFFKGQENKSLSKRASDIISLLDSRIQIGEISSYSLEFNSGSSFIIGDINFINGKDRVYIDKISPYMTGIIKGESEEVGKWEFQIIGDGIIKDTEYGEGSGGSISFDLNRYGVINDLEAETYLNGKQLNKIVFYNLNNSLSSDRVSNDEIKMISLSGVTANDDTIRISNVFGEKKIQASTGSTFADIDSFEMTLGKGNKEITTIIKTKDD